MIENILCIGLFVGLLVFFIKWCVPVLESEKIRAEKEKKYIDLKIEKIQLEIEKMKG